MELPSRKGFDDLILELVRGPGEILDAVLARRGVEPDRDAAPGLAIVGHIGVAKPVQLACEQLRVDHLENRNSRLAILSHHDIAERTQRPYLRLGEEPDRRHLLDPGEHDPPGRGVPMTDLVKQLKSG